MIQIVVDKQVVNQEIKDILKKYNITFKEIDVETKLCPVCEKEFIVRGLGTSTERKFCSFTCRSRGYARIKHEFDKLNPEYKQKKKEYFEKWRKENREHFNDLVREPNRIRAFENYHKFDELGVCVQCGRERDNPNSKTCIKCFNSNKIKKGEVENEM